MRADQPVVSAASWMVSASICGQCSGTLTQLCQGLARAAASSQRSGCRSVRIRRVTAVAEQHLEAELEQKVTSLELFFDLVFVFAITQVTTMLAGDLTW